MSISTETYQWVYNGNATATLFDYTQPIQLASDLEAFIINPLGGQTNLVNGVDYQVNGVGNSNQATWQVKYPISGSPLPNNWQIVVRLAMPITTNTNITTLTSNTGPVIQGAIDRLDLQLLTVKKDLDLKLGVPYGESTDTSVLIQDINNAVASTSADAAAAAQSAIDAENAAQNVSVFTYEYTATGGETSISISGGLPSDLNSVDVYIDGVHQQKSSLTRTSDTVLGLGGALTAGSLVMVKTGYNYTNSSAIISGRQYAGCVTIPSFTDNGSGNATIGASICNFYVSTTGNGKIEQHTCTSISPTFTDNAINYVVSDYNNGSPLIRVTLTRSEINFTTVLPLYTVWRSGSNLHYINWDKSGLALGEKLLNRVINNKRFERDEVQGGLLLGEAATRLVTVSAGTVWFGVNNQSLLAFNSGTDILQIWTSNAGVWSSSTVTQYNNSQYNAVGGPTALTSNRYAVNFVYRGVENDKHCYILLGTGDYTLAQAQASQPTLTPPDFIRTHAILVGRIIVQQGSSTATQIDTAFVVGANFTQIA